MGPGTAVDYDRSLRTRYAVISEILAEPLVNSKGLRWAATLVIVQHCVPGIPRPAWKPSLCVLSLVNCNRSEGV